MTRCDSSSCWCSWPPVRVIPSTGQGYTVEEIEPGLYRYKYTEDIGPSVAVVDDRLNGIGQGATPAPIPHHTHAEVRMAVKQSISERFWSKVDRRGDLDACWPWLGSTVPAGYGRIWNHGRTVGAHRVAYELAIGPVPSGLDVCHRCDNPPCCNPAHLFLGTAADNIADCMAKGRLISSPGIRNGGAKLTAAQVIEIRASASAGLSHRKIAERYGLRHAQIGRIVRRESWTLL